MALGGGTFLVQNKVLPGTYINFVSRPRALGSLGERGIAAFLLEHNWGAEDTVVTVTAADFQKEALSIFGYSYTDDELIYMREVFSGASSVKFYRPSGAKKATADHEGLKITAICGGTRGNDITITVTADVDAESGNSFYVRTLIGADNIQVDEQYVSSISELKANDYVTFSGSADAELAATAGVTLTGGEDKTLTGNDYATFLDKIEAEDFTTLIYPGSDDTTKGLYTSFVKRLRDDEGYKITAVVHDYKKADYEGVISVKNMVENEGIKPTALVYWVGGHTAGAEVNQSLTNKMYDGELTINVTYKKAAFEQAINDGEIIFYGEKDQVRLLKDVNTFTSFEAYKNKDFANNQVIRVLDEIANSTARIFDTYYLGKMQNDETGRTLFKAELISYHDQLQSISAITNFSADDIVVTKGAEKGDVVVDEAVEPVGAMDILYMSVTVI